MAMDEWEVTRNFPEHSGEPAKMYDLLREILLQVASAAATLRVIKDELVHLREQGATSTDDI